MKILSENLDEFGLPVDEDYTEVDGEEYNIFQKVVTGKRVILQLIAYPLQRDRRPMSEIIGRASFEVLKGRKLKEIFSQAETPEILAALRKTAEKAVKHLSLHRVKLRDA